jgi:hypothetical protein
MRFTDNATHQALLTPTRIPYARPGVRLVRKMNMDVVTIAERTGVLEVLDSLCLNVN